MKRSNRYLLYIILVFCIPLCIYIKHNLGILYDFLCCNIGKTCFWTSIVLAVICVLIEYFYMHRNVYKNNPICLYQQEVSPFYFDVPTTEDLFNRKKYAKLLVDKVYSSFYDNRCKSINHSFVIHIGEHYGHGKTSFLMILNDELSNGQCPSISINFEPWLCDTEAGIVNEFFEIFRKEVSEYLPKLNVTLKQYVQLLLSSFEYEKASLNLKLSKIFGCISSLKDAHDKIRDALLELDRPIIITVDDVDRLQSKELMMVMKIIRDTADFPNVFYIVAADNIHLEQMLGSLNIVDPANYLKKFFNLEFNLPANENIAFNKLLELLRNKYEALHVSPKRIALYESQIENVTYIKDAFPNMRDVYRFVNAYFLSLESKDDVVDLNLFELFLLTMIHMLDGEYYMQLRDNYLSLLDIVRSGNDIILQWKADYNIIQQKQEKETLEQVERISAKDGNNIRRNKRPEDINILTFEETLADSRISSKDIIIVIMNILFGKKTYQIEQNSACRHNMFFKYFSDLDASYMVSKVTAVALICSDEKKYRQGLREIFESNRDDYFLSEFMYMISSIRLLTKTEVLKRFFIFIELCYDNKRMINDVFSVKSLADYEGKDFCRDKIYQVLARLYDRNRYEENEQGKDIEQKNFEEFCSTEEDYNILLVSLNLMSNHLGNFLFDRSVIEKCSKLLVNRFLSEKISSSNGVLNYQEIDTIAQINCDYNLDEYWMNGFVEYLKTSKEACLNILSKLIVFYKNGNVEWDWPYRKAILGEYKLPEDNILSRLSLAFPENKKIFDSLYSLQNNCRSLRDVDGLDKNEFVIMAKQVQGKLSAK